MATRGPQGRLSSPCVLHSSVLGTGMHSNLFVTLPWEFVFQPTYAAYLNLIESWWKVLRSLALKGRRFETWEQVCQAIEAATVYWNAHRHPFVWGRRRRHRSRRQAGIAVLAKAA